MRKHTGERPFRRDVEGCDYATTRAWLVSRHKSTRHGIGTDAGDGEQGDDAGWTAAAAGSGGEAANPQQQPQAAPAGLFTAATPVVPVPAVSPSTHNWLSWRRPTTCRSAAIQLSPFICLFRSLRRQSCLRSFRRLIPAARTHYPSPTHCCPQDQPVEASASPPLYGAGVIACYAA